MELIIVRIHKDCFKKYLVGIDDYLEKDLRQKLHILSNPDSYGFSDIQDAKSLKNKISTFIDVSNHFPPLKSVFQFINNLDDTESVVLLDGEKYDNKEIMTWQHALKGYESGKNPVDVLHFLKYHYPATYYPRHDLYLYADFGYNQFYGEWDKNKRKCRFCHTQSPDIFGDPKDSHAISFSLGNERLFCLEECKSCNVKFGKGIEQHLSNYYEFFRASDKRKSRKGKPLTSKGFNYDYTGGTIRYVATSPNDNITLIGNKIPSEGIKLQLNSDKPVVLHQCYRALVKYVLSCLPTSLLPAFAATIEWVKGNKKPRRHMLPPVYRYEQLESVQHPSLCVYVRRDDKKDLPYCVGELRFLENLFVFALPYCKGHDVMPSQLSKPLDTFVKKRYPDMAFTIENFCDDEEKMITSHVLLGGETLKLPVE